MTSLIAGSVLVVSGIASIFLVQGWGPVVVFSAGFLLLLTPSNIIAATRDVMPFHIPRFLAICSIIIFDAAWISVCVIDAANNLVFLAAFLSFLLSFNITVNLVKTVFSRDVEL
jgi:hypothetical protein